MRRLDLSSLWIHRETRRVHAMTTLLSFHVTMTTRAYLAMVMNLTLTRNAPSTPSTDTSSIRPQVKLQGFKTPLSTHRDRGLVQQFGFMTTSRHQHSISTLTAKNAIRPMHCSAPAASVVTLSIARISTTAITSTRVSRRKVYKNMAYSISCWHWIHQTRLELVVYSLRRSTNFSRWMLMPKVKQYPGGSGQCTIKLHLCITRKTDVSHRKCDDRHSC
mmetsp:Transcript_56229/g.136279  ORF Transcript_56229/g.136279 Transcript_56229/m.136279 type:complete len:218 (+) Transcript_56229:2824-3477(+)